MGLLKELRRVGRGARAVGGELEDAFNAVTLGYQRRVQEPFAYDILMAKRHPVEFLTSLLGYPTGEDYAGRSVRARFLGGRARREIEASLPKKQPYRTVLLGASDPLTWTGLGAVTRAGVRGLQAAEAARAGGDVSRLLGLRLGATEMGKELGGQLGLGLAGQAASAVTAPLRAAAEVTPGLRDLGLVARVNRGKRLTRLVDIGGMIEDTQRAARTSLDTLSESERGLLLRQGDTLRLRLAEEAAKPTPNPRRVEALLGQFDELRARMVGATVDASDIRRHVRSGVAALVGARVRPLDEYETSARALLQPPNAAERAASRIPILNRIWSAVNPALQAKLGDDISASHIGWLTVTNHLNDKDTQVGRALSYYARKAGLSIDDARHLRANGQDLGYFEEAYQRVDALRAAGKLTPEQHDVLRAFTNAVAAKGEETRNMLTRAGVNPRDPDWLELLGAPKAGGRAFIPRVAQFISVDKTPEDFAGAMSSRSFLDRIRGKVPEGWQPTAPVRRGPGSRQATQFERVNAGEAEHTIFAGDVGEVYAAHAQQLNQIVGWEATALPLIDKLAIPRNQIIGKELNAARYLTGLRKGNAARLVALAKTIAQSGHATPTQANSLRALLAREGAPDGARSLLDAVDTYVHSGPFRAPRVEEAAQLRRVEKTEALGIGAEARTQPAITHVPEGEVFYHGSAGEISGELPAGAFVTPSREDAEVFAQAQARLTGQPAKVVELRVQPGALRPTEEGLAAARGAMQIADPSGVRVFRPTVEGGGGVTARQGARLGAAARQAGKGAREADVFAQESRAQERAARSVLVKTARTVMRSARDDAAIQRARLVKLNAAAKTKVQRATMAGLYRQVRDIPGLNSKVFEAKIADAIEKAYGTGQYARGPGAIPGWLVAGNAFLQTIAAGFDMSVAMIQGLATMAVDPLGWGKAMTYGMGGALREDIYWRYMTGMARQVDAASGESILTLAQRAKLSMSGTELFRPSEALRAMEISGSGPFRAVQWLDRLPPNKAWAMGRNMASLEMFRSQVSLESALVGGRALTDDELQGIARQVDLASGAADYQRLGVGRTQQAVERLTVRFGAQWFRSQTGRLVQAFNAGMDGRVARRILLHQMGAMTMMYVAAAHALGQEPDLQPLRADGSFNTGFLTLTLGKQRIGFSTPYRTMMRLVVDSTQAIESDNAAKLASIRTGRAGSPLFNFWRSGAPVLAGLVADLALEAKGRSDFPTTVDEPYELVTPFSLQAAINAASIGGPGEPSKADVTAGYLASVFGLNANIRSPNELWRDETQRVAQERGFKDWNDIPQAQQRALLHDDADLRAATEAKEAYFARFKQDKTDWAFAEMRKGQDAVQDVLAARWPQVQSGQLSKSDFRQTVSDLVGKQAALADTLMADVPEGTRKKPKLLQDQLAQLYESISPERVQMPNGTVMSVDDAPTPEEQQQVWAQWRANRQRFWVDHPEATPFRNYIEVEYPASKYTGAAQEAMTQRRQAQAEFDALLQLPKYRGMSVSDGEFFDDVRGLASAASREIRNALAARGADVSRIQVPTQLAWRYALAQLRGVQLTPRQTQLLRLAVRIDLSPRSDVVLRSLLSADRARYIIAHPDVANWYPSAYQQAGLPDALIARLQLRTSPMTPTIPGRVQSAAQQASVQGATSPAPAYLTTP